MVMHKDCDNVFLQLYSTAPAPSRDYYGLTVTTTDVILNIWNVTHGPHVYPKRQKASLVEFDSDRGLKDDIKRVFGQHITEYIACLARGDCNIQYLPSKVFLAIIRLLANNDILHLSQTSKIFFELCSSNAVWKILFRKKTKKGPSQFDKVQSEYIPWRELLKKKVGSRRHAGKRPIRELLNGSAPSLAEASKADFNNMIKNLPLKKKDPNDPNSFHIIDNLKTSKSKSKGTSPMVAASPKTPLSLTSLMPKVPNTPYVKSLNVDLKSQTSFKSTGTATMPSNRSQQSLNLKASSQMLDTMVKEMLDSADYSTPFMKGKVVEKSVSEKNTSTSKLVPANVGPKAKLGASASSVAAVRKSTSTPLSAPAQQRDVVKESKRIMIHAKSVPKSVGALGKEKPVGVVGPGGSRPSGSSSGNKVNVGGTDRGRSNLKRLVPITIKKPLLSDKQKLYVHSVP